jgi:uncharacterized protein
VNDFASVLSPQAREELTTLCREVDQKAQAQIAIVTIHALEGVPIEDFSMDLATRWGIGPKQKDRGVLILVAVDDHRYRVEIGYGLEGILPDGKVGSFGREMIPLLRHQDYNRAVLLLTERIAHVIAQEREVTLTSSGTEVPRFEAQPHLDWVGPLIAVIFFLVAFLWRGWLGARGRRHTRWMGGPWVARGSGGVSWGRGSWSGGGGFGGFGGGSFGGGGTSGSW